MESSTAATLEAQESLGHMNKDAAADHHLQSQNTCEVNEDSPAQPQTTNENSEDNAMSPIPWPEPLLDDFSDPHWPDLSKDDTSVLAWIVQHKKVLIRTITWNMCGKAAPPKELLVNGLLAKDKFHIYVIGTEECERSIAQSAINPSKKAWEKYLSETIGKNYVPIRAQTLQAIHIIAFVHRRIAHLCSEVKSAAVPTGVGKTLGNKGGTCIYFKLGGTTMCFVNAHLSAHQKAERRRNAEFHRIMRRMPILLDSKDSMLSPRSALEAPAPIEQSHQHVPLNGILRQHSDINRSIRMDPTDGNLPASLTSTEPVGKDRKHLHSAGRMIAADVNDSDLTAEPTSATGQAQNGNSSDGQSHENPQAAKNNHSHSHVKLPSINQPADGVVRESNVSEGDGASLSRIDSKMKLPPIGLKPNSVSAPALTATSAEDCIEPSSKQSNQIRDTTAHPEHGDFNETSLANDIERDVQNRIDSSAAVEDVIGRDKATGEAVNEANDNEEDEDVDKYDDENELFSDIENGNDLESPRPSQSSSADNTDNDYLQRFNSFGDHLLTGVDNNGSYTLDQITDVMIFMGDLNYRINGNRSIVSKLLERKMHEVLLSNDQLRSNKEKGMVFQRFHEPPLHFKPTYKYDVGSNNYDTSGKSRIPSWTDRILYVPTDKIACMAYNSEDSVMTSDHRPVYASFAVRLESYVDVEGAANDEEQASPEFKSQSQVCSIM